MTALAKGRKQQQLKCKSTTIGVHCQVHAGNNDQLHKRNGQPQGQCCQHRRMRQRQCPDCQWLRVVCPRRTACKPSALGPTCFSVASASRPRWMGPSYIFLKVLSVPSRPGHARSKTAWNSLRSFWMGVPARQQPPHPSQTQATAVAAGVWITAARQPVLGFPCMHCCQRQGACKHGPTAVLSSQHVSRT